MELLFISSGLVVPCAVVVVVVFTLFCVALCEEEVSDERFWFNKIVKVLFSRARVKKYLLPYPIREKPIMIEEMMIRNVRGLSTIVLFLFDVS